MRSLPRGSSVLIAAALLVLVGCTPHTELSPTPIESEPHPTPTSQVVIGAPVLPLGCAELLTSSEVLPVVPGWEVTVDETHIRQGIDAAADLQNGALYCVWGDASYPSTGWADHIELSVVQSPGPLELAEDSAPDLEMLEDSPPTAIGECDVFGGAYCRVAQLRDGYRIDLRVYAQLTSPAEVRRQTLGLLEHVGGAIDVAGPPRAVEAPTGASNPVEVCEAAGIRTVVEARGAAGSPTMMTDTSRPLAPVSSCVWDPTGSGDPAMSIVVNVLPGGAWAYPFIAQGGPYAMSGYRTSPDGGYLIGASGDAFAALRTIGPDLVTIYAPWTANEDQTVWEQLLADTW
ncbi:MAG: hypothetical protein ACTHMQ_11685 [Protaetiibacter sp.]